MKTTNTRRPVIALSLFGLLALGLAGAPAVHANTSSVSVSQFYGSFSTAVEIPVTPYRSLTPQVVLSYNSQGSNGFVGAGWSLSGHSVIERVGPGRGAPTFVGTGATCSTCYETCYDAYGYAYSCNPYSCNCSGGTDTDEFTFDGSQLVACTAAMTSSPSCTTGGTHAGRTENYLKIQRDTVANKWYVWTKDGTKRTFSAIFATTLGTFRWGLTEVRDTKNNYVTYAWACDGSFECYPSTITYNGTVVTFHKALRPDPILFSTGNTTMGKTQYRLTAISVKVSGLMARTFKLTYDAAGRAGRSYLASVQQYGTNATVSADGVTVTGTTAPAQTFSRAAGNLRLAPTYRTGMYRNATGDWNFTGDFDGDGKTDLLSVKTASLGAAVYYINWGKGGATAYSAGQINTGAKFNHVGDFDGDGRDDILAIYTKAWGTGTAYLTTFSTTGVKTQSYKTGLYINTTDKWNRTGDFNGDGKADLAAVNATGWGTAKVYVNYIGLGTYMYDATGLYLNSNADWLHVGDFNGDGKADLLSVYTASLGAGTAYINYMNSASTAFDTPVIKSGMYINGTTSWNRVGDFNGDGKQDLLAVGTTGMARTATVYVNHGSGPTVNMPVAAYSTLSLNGGPEWMHTGDFDGDGLTDILSVETAALSGKVWINYSKGNGFLADQHAGVNVNANAGRNNVGDFNGDGRDDFLSGYIDAWGTGTSYFNNQAAPLDQTSCAGNSMGGKTTIAYTASSAWVNTNNPPLVQTVGSMAVDDGRGNSSTSSYTYSGGLFDKAGRRFLGFRYVKTTLPCNTGESSCPYDETWFKQDYGSVSKPEQINRRAGGGQLLTSTVQSYTTNGSTVPYTSTNTGTWVYAYDGSGASCGAWPCAYGARTYTSRTFDNYGNRLLEYSYGDYDVSGDEKTTSMVYYKNTSLFIAALPGVNRLYHGIGTGGTLLEEALTTYDANTTYSQIPTAGLPTKVSRLASTTPSYLDVLQQYDTYGNVTAEIGPTHRTAMLYDATYHLYRTETRDPKYFGDAQNPVDTRHKKTLSIDARCGAETQAVEMSGLVVTRLYDTLCRLTRLSDNAGYFENHSYVSVGTPSAQYVQVETPAAGTGNLWHRTYLDGLGRTYKAMSKGPVTADIIEETTYSKRSQISGKTLPYYTGETPKWLTVTHDALDRVVRTTYPDGGFASKTYGVGTVTLTDEKGAVRQEWKDGLGRVTKRRQYRAGVALDTTYQYNTRGQATKTIDHKGNVFEVTYNALGQRATYKDPNRGTSTYEYNAAGHQSAVVDALGQRIEYSYDILGRKTKQIEKKVGGAVEQTITWTYDQARTGYYNVGGLTSMTDGQGTATFDYDLKGNLVKASRVLGGSTYTFTHSYDAGARLKSTNLPDGDLIGRTYDNSGRPLTIAGYVNGATYNARGQLLTLTRANGTVSTFAYDANRTWLTDIDTLKGATVIQNLHYTRDPVGRTTQVTSQFPDEGWNYAYDDLGFLTAATAIPSSATHNQTFQYDTTGNITRVVRPGGSAWNYTYNSAHGAASVRPHAVVTAGANAYTYDAVGNMKTGAGRTITWGVNGLPSKVNNDYLYYDGNGARVKKVVGATTTYYVSGEYEVTGSTVTKYVSFSGESVAKKVGATKYYLHQDGLGSIQAVTDANGLEVTRMKYRPYGERLSTAGSHVEGRSFTGQRQDESGLFYLNARYYDPQLGRFISADPVIPSADTVGLNRYAYAGNDPINNLDTNGLSFWKKLKKFFKKIWKAIVKVVKALVNLVKAAFSGDWKAILTLVILVATIYFGGIALAWAVQAAGASAATIAASGAMVAAMEAGAGAMLAAAGMSAVVGFASSFAIGLVQTGSLQAAFKAGINGAIGGLLNTALNFGMMKLGLIKGNQMGTDPADGTYKIGFSEKFSTGMSERFHQTKGYFNSATGQGMAQFVHDPFASFLKNTIIGAGRVAEASLLRRDIYALLNISTAFIFQAAGEAIATSVLEQAFGKMHETPWSAINNLNGATSFFSIPKDLPPGQSRESIAKSAIKIRW